MTTRKCGSKVTYPDLGCTDGDIFQMTEITGKQTCVCAADLCNMAAVTSSPRGHVIVAIALLVHVVSGVYGK